MNKNRNFMCGVSAVMVLALVTVPFAAFGAANDNAKAKSPLMSIKVSPYTERPIENAESVAQGKAIYDKACTYCHGLEGKGDGPAAVYLSRDTAPRPRDFTSGIYKFRSTLSGELPMDEDIFHTITKGVVGYMPGFVGMPAEDRWKVTYYLKSMYAEFKGSVPEAIAVVGGPIPGTAVSVNKGYKVYTKFKCWECHGGGGQGNGSKAADLKDDWGFPLPPRDLTRLNIYKNGSADIDIYRSIMAGLDGGAMPSYADFFAGEEENVWHLINYIRSLSQ